MSHSRLCLRTSSGDRAVFSRTGRCTCGTEPTGVTLPCIQGSNTLWWLGEQARLVNLLEIWGLVSRRGQRATRWLTVNIHRWEETAYPMRQSKMIAMVSVRSLIRLEIQCYSDVGCYSTCSSSSTVEDQGSNWCLVSTSRIPAWPTYKLSFRISGDNKSSPNVNIFQRLGEELTISAEPRQIFKGSSPAPCNHSSWQGNYGDDTVVQPDIFKLNAPKDKSRCMVQTWSILWDPDQFTDDVVKVGHPMDI